MPETTKKELSRREAIRMGELWKQAVESGMAEREIICLQDGHTLQELAAILGLSRGRVSQIRAKAKRKMRHPKRRELCIALGLQEKVELDQS